MSEFNNPDSHESAPRAADVDDFVRLQLVDQDGNDHPIDTRFQYNQYDPYAVKLVFLHPDPEKIKVWTFARSLLADGMYEPVDPNGDVTVWPTLNSEGEACVAIHLSGSAQSCTLMARTRIVQRFLTATTNLVPSGCESNFTSFDTELEAILNG